MDRNDIYNQINNCTERHIALSCPTSFGKTKASLDYISSKFKDVPKLNILIVIPKLVLIDNWKKEVQKWHPEFEQFITYTTYISLAKHKGVLWDVVVLDECHHMSDRCKNIWKEISYVKMIGLSATIGRNVTDWIKSLNNSKIIYVSMREAIDSNILPDPTVYLIPLKLDNTQNNQILIRNKSAKDVIECEFKDRWQYLHNKSKQVHIHCTQLQYYTDITNTINYYKENMINERIYLAKCNQRLKWLSRQKTDYIKDILKHLKNYRTLTFCADIEQTEQLGAHAINSQNKTRQQSLELFNTNKIKHVTTCEILTEGVNLSDCRVGIYACLNSKPRLQTQKNGRILRHKKPVIIIPYYVNTREEEIVNKMLLTYNPNLVKTINSINELKIN